MKEVSQKLLLFLIKKTDSASVHPLCRLLLVLLSSDQGLLGYAILLGYLLPRLSAHLPVEAHSVLLWVSLTVDQAAVLSG